MDYQFLKYELTPGEKHFGLCTIRAWGKIILRYKLVDTQKGGYFPGVCGYKNPSIPDAYVPAFLIDSTYEKDEIETFVRHNCKEFMAKQGKDIHGFPMSNGAFHSDEAGPSVPVQAVAYPPPQQNPNPQTFSQPTLPGLTSVPPLWHETQTWAQPQEVPF